MESLLLIIRHKYFGGEYTDKLVHQVFNNLFQERDTIRKELKSAELSSSINMTILINMKLEYT